MDIKIALDAMGGDHAPVETIKGAVDAAIKLGASVILVGKDEIISEELAKYSYPKEKISIVNAPSVIEMHEVPTQAIKKKKDSSIVVGLSLLKDNKAHAFVSAGSTGALLAGATLIVGRIKGIERPALATLLPNEKGFSFMLDSGANVDVKPTYLVQFAKIGSIYMENVMGIKNPTVGLVNIGSEKEKGNILTKEAYTLLEQSDLNFYGNVEAREIPHGAVDVIVCDGFVGNIILKYTEGFSKAMLGMIKKELLSSTISKVGALLSKGAFSNLKAKFNYSDVGGAPFLGLNALVVKAHGSSDSRAVTAAIRQCIAFSENGIINKIEQKL